MPATNTGALTSAKTCSSGLCFRSKSSSAAKRQRVSVVFPSLAPDVKEFSIHVKGIALRYNYRDEPVETKDLTFRFQREVFKGFKPPPELVNKQ